MTPPTALVAAAAEGESGRRVHVKYLEDSSLLMKRYPYILLRVRTLSLAVRTAVYTLLLCEYQ